MDPFHSVSWHRVASLHPTLNRSVRFHRHVYRGEIWYVVRNPATGQVHRLTPAAYALAGLLDGRRSVEEARDVLVERLGEEAPSRDESVGLLGLLHAADLVQSDVPPDTAALLRRMRTEESLERRQRRSPLAFRVPLFDPDAFLERTSGAVAPLFSRIGAVAWCAIVLSAGVLALRHAPELDAAWTTLMSPSGLLALWFVYPAMKALHELGHAFAVKRGGGEVHEIGILFLVFVPLPYVDASAASIHPDKRQRMIVDAAGIAVELLLAALATFLWVATEPGGIRQAAFATMLIGGVSTVFFNGNPLLRFDGYHLLADTLEMPNLAPRASCYVGALARRWILGVRGTRIPETATGEAPWLVGYAIASFCYRTAVLLAIALFLADRFFVLGVALALFTLASAIVLPVLRRVAHVWADPEARERPARTLAGGLGLVATVGVVLFGIPFPLRTVGEGVIWLPEQSHVRAGAAGFVTKVLIEPHVLVHPGQTLIRTHDPTAETRVRVLEARRRELGVRVFATARQDRVQADIARQRLADAEAELARARELTAEVAIRSSTAGTFVPVHGRDLLGRWVAQGEVLGYVVDRTKATARVAIAQEDVGLLRERTSAAWVRLAHDVGTVHPARIVREVPAATNRLPTLALGTRGGGSFELDPDDPDGLSTTVPFFQFDLALPDEARIAGVGERVHVRFDHGTEPLGHRAHRALRRLFLRRLGV